MTLQELADYAKDLLDAGHNPSGRVLLATQQSYPFENDLTGICTRGDIAEMVNQRDEEDEEETSELQSWQHVDDVLLCEGRQLGYGTRSAWEVAETWRK